MSHSSPPSEEAFRAVLKRAAAAGLGDQLPFASPIDRSLFGATRLLASGSILLLGFLLPCLLIVAGWLWHEPFALLGGLGVLAISTSLSAMIISGQRRLKRMFQSLAALTGLHCRQHPDVIPGLYHLSLAGELRGRYVAVNIENHAEAGIESYRLEETKHYRKRSRQYLVVRVRCDHPQASGLFRPLRLKAASDAREVAELLTPALLSWLTETHHRDELMVGAGAVGFRWNAAMTPEGFQQIREGISLAVELAEQLDRQAEWEQQDPQAHQ